MADIWTASRLWPGATVAVVASGPSLDCAQVRLLGRGRAERRIRVIAVNDAVYPCWFADALYACDARWWNAHKGVPGFGGLRVMMDTTAKDLKVGQDIKVMRNTGTDGFEERPNGIRTGRNSGYQAMNLAAHLGVKGMILVGFDMKPAGDRLHYFGSHDDEGLNDPNPIWFRETAVPKFKELGRALATLGITVVNATPGSALTMFHMKQLRDALP